MAAQDEVWIPLVDEPIGSIVAELEAEDREIARLVGGPRRTLAFKTFAYVKVGLLLGELLVDSDVATDGETSCTFPVIGSRDYSMLRAAIAHR